MPKDIITNEYTSTEQINDFVNIYTDIDKLSDNTVLMEYDYPDRYINGMLLDNYVRIGDTVLPYSADDISITTTNEILNLSTLRSSTAQLFMTGKCNKIIQMSFFFNSLVDIAGKELNVPFVDANGEMKYISLYHNEHLTRKILNYTAFFEKCEFYCYKC